MVKDALAGCLAPATLAADRRPPQFGSPSERADQLPNRPPQCRVAQAEFAMLAFHHFDEPLGQRDRRAIGTASKLLDSNERERCEGRKHREPAVDRVANAAFDIPVAFARFGGERSE